MRSLLAGPYGPRILGIVLLVASAGCAYYNTFYLAKKYYREGAKAQEHSLTDAPSPEAATKFDLVIRQCNKVLTDYSKSKYVDDASYLMGAAMYGKGDYDNAIQRLADFQTKFPKSPYVADARFMEGLSYYRRKDYDIADSILQDVEVQFPKFERKWELQFYSGETNRSWRGTATPRPPTPRRSTRRRSAIRGPTRSAGWGMLIWRATGPTPPPPCTPAVSR